MKRETIGTIRMYENVKPRVNLRNDTVKHENKKKLKSKNKCRKNKGRTTF